MSVASSSLRAARAVSIKLSPEPDEELILSFLDKSVLIVVWTIAIIYSVMSPSIIRYIRNSLRSDDDRQLVTSIETPTLTTSATCGKTGAARQVR